MMKKKVVKINNFNNSKDRKKMLRHLLSAEKDFAWWKKRYAGFVFSEKAYKQLEDLGLVHHDLDGVEINSVGKEM